jgi:tRNA(Ile)-lysidine synthase TilS/MesJ
MKRCTRCVLPETFPGIQFDDDGVCQYCRRVVDPAQLMERKARLRTRFEALVEEIHSRDGYQCLMSWSGGKDSTYTLSVLKERYGLRVLAFTLDNGFVSPTALDNMRTVAESLAVDHVIVKPCFDRLRRIFVASAQPGTYPPRALERASGICNACMAVAKGLGLRLALEQNIPMLAYGWSPGQIPTASTIFHPTPRMLKATVVAAMAPLREAVGDEVALYFPGDRHLDDAEQLPYNVSPLAFLDYDEKEALKHLRSLGWERPQDTDPNSTNCLLNSFANLVHVEQMGYHPYALELSGLVRQGYLTREEALERLKTPAMPEVVSAVRAKLRMPIPTGRRLSVLKEESLLFRELG